MITEKNLEFEDIDLEDELDEALLELEDDIVIDDSDLDIRSFIKPDLMASQQDELGRYLEDITHFPRISHEEEVVLANLIKAGVEAKAALTTTNQNELTPIIQAGYAAREKLINANYRLVISVAKQFSRACTATITFLDIIQSGNLGLMTAVDRFDASKGFKFSTYATWWIRQRIRRDIINTAQTIRIPVHIHDVLSKMYHLEREYGSLTHEELATMLNLRVDQIARLYQIREEMSIVYLDRELDTQSEDVTSFLEMVPSSVITPDILFKLKERDDYLFTMLSGILTDREQYVIMRRFGMLGDTAATLETLGKEFGVSRERIRQIEAKALRKLRSPKIQRELRDFLDLK